MGGSSDHKSWEVAEVVKVRVAGKLQVSPKRVASNLGLSWTGTALFSPSANKGST